MIETYDDVFVESYTRRLRYLCRNKCKNKEELEAKKPERENVRDDMLTFTEIGVGDNGDSNDIVMDWSFKIAIDPKKISSISRKNCSLFLKIQQCNREFPQNVFKKRVGLYLSKSIIT